ncbi:MAG: cell envelope integrity protein TolA [Rudaea sp.]
MLCIAALFIGLMWSHSEVQEVKLKGPVIDVDLVGITTAQRAPSRPKPAPKPTPPKPQPQEAVKPPEPVPEPPTQPTRNDRVEREKIAQIAQEKADKERAEQEQHKQEQVLLEQQEKQERDRQKQLEQIRRDREKAEKLRKLEQEKLAQLTDLQKPQKPVKPIAQPVPEDTTSKSGGNGQDDSLDAQYFAAIQNAVTNNWLRPDSAQGGLHCMLHIVQIPGGDVIGVQVANPCNADPLTRASIEQAVKRASPLPFKGFEKSFRREFNFNFSFDG